ncbi:UNVERIFIED_CONTAM: hypothetical protein K2H54_065030 [Gekko kuhli]
MDTYEEIARGMQARGHNRSWTECCNKTKGMRAEYKRVLLHNNTFGNDRITCPYFKELHSILKGDPSVKPRRAADSYQHPPVATAAAAMAPEVPFTPAEGSEELFTMTLEPIETPSDSMPDEDAEQLPDTGETSLGNRNDDGPSTSTPDDGEDVPNSGETDAVDPGAILSEMTPAERLEVIRSRKKCVTTVQRVGEQFLKAAARDREAAKREHDELLHEMRSSRQEERDVRELRVEILRSTLQVLSDIAKAITQPSAQGRDGHCSKPCCSGHQSSEENLPGTSAAAREQNGHAKKKVVQKPNMRRHPKKKIPFSPSQ